MIQDALAGYLVNAAWQVPVVALCALLVSRFGGLSPRSRNALWLTFLAAAAILPAICLDGVLPHALPTVARVAPSGLADAAPVLAVPTSEPSPAPAAEPVLRLSPWAVWLMAALCGAIAVLLVARLVLAAAAARRLVLGAQPANLPAEAIDAIRRLAEAHGRTAPPVLRSAAVASPAVVGALKPVILVPERLDASCDELRAALLHEMAHVLRHDYAVNLACELLTLPVSWHPALIGLKAGVRRSRELACDAIAASAMASQKTYARCLVSLAESLGAAPDAQRRPHAAPTQAALAVGLFGRSDLEDRLMHLMKPRDAEGPFVSTARICGLAAVGASLLGSAVLLHVTPVFAQVAPVAAPTPVAAAPLATPAAPAQTGSAATAAAAADQASHDAAKPGHRGILIQDKNVIIEKGHGGYRHSWTGADGETMTVINDTDGELTPEQERQLEARVRDAEAKAAKAEAYVNSPEFKARIAKAQEQAAKAEAYVNSPEFKARIAKAEEQAAKAEAYVNSAEFKARIAKAEEAGKAAEAYVNSPEFKARIAQAQAQAAKAQAYVNSPEFKARIAKAAEQSAKAQAYVNSAEFRAQMEELRNLGPELQRQLDDPPPSRTTP